MKNTTKAVIFFAFATLLSYASCKKSDNDSVTSVSRITGVWTMHGTHEYLAHGITSTIKDARVNVWLADDTTIVVYSEVSVFSGYSVYKLNNNGNSTVTFGDYTYNSKKNSLKYYDYYPTSGNYQIVSLQSDNHTPFTNSLITSNTGKMIGKKEWHGSYRTLYIPPWQTGLPDVDTTYYHPLTMQINALSDTLIMVGTFCLGSNDVCEHLFLRKTYDDQSTTIFTSADNPYQTITYRAVDNSMFYFDSSGGVIPSVLKYYTP